MSFVGVVGLLMVTFHTVLPLECYNCGNVDSGPCFAPKDLHPPTLVCTANANPNVTASEQTDFSCYAVHLTFSIDAKAVERGCIRKELTEGLCTRWATLGEGIHEVDSCQLCDTDLCNSGAQGLSLISFVIIMYSTLGLNLIN